VTDQPRRLPSKLQLDTDLRLHPQQLTLGNAELLTDALRLPFTDIESRLGHYVLGATETEKTRLRSSMKNYLGRLNANPHIPLKFRLNVLNRFEQELDLFDAEMTVAVLNAHKVGVALVQEAARLDNSYFPMLVEMVANAIELAIKLLRIDLQHYRAPAVIVTRQFFELAKLGLEVATSLHQHHAANTARLHKAICNHEFLRRLDFFSQSPHQQQQVWHELQYHIDAIQPFFYRRTETWIHPANDITMLINLNRPHEAGRIISQLSNQSTSQSTKTAPFDCIAIPLDAFIGRLGKGMRSVRQVLSNEAAQNKALHTEDALESTMIGGKAILMALKTEKRHSTRSTCPETRVQLNQHLSAAITRVFPSDCIDEQPVECDPMQAWNVVNANDNGVCLERIHDQPLSELLGWMVGLDWSFAAGKEGDAANLSNMAGLGLISWVREHKAGEQRIGIEFFPKPDTGSPFQLAKAIMLGGSKELQEKRTWPILIRSDNNAYKAIFPATNMYKNMTFMVLQGRHKHHFKICNVTMAGSNYSCCDIIPADKR